MRSFDLSALESESIGVIREAVAGARRPVMLYSIGKDSSVMLYLTRVDTTWISRDMYAHRALVAAGSGIEPIIHVNQEGLAAGINPFNHNPSCCTDGMKTQGLPQALDVDKQARAALKRQKPCCVWFTGLSGAGKTTIANLLEKRLHDEGKHTYVLDGDNVRHGLNYDLGFTEADRVENIRRVAEVARLMVDAGLIVLVALISPFRAERRFARGLFAEGEFVEVFVDAPLEECERRDPKGLYARARRGEIKNFTGIDSVYEPPESPEIHLRTTEAGPEACVETILQYLR
ncbi:adenylyl-sulfate kinase [Desulforudis sp. 1031]|uniref:adenylyl-sulfate kinase n=1 Tax=unclassified Candidatus Desulforudis TaxID=2635950 RepID=UPI003CF6017C